MTDPLEQADALRRAGHPREALAMYQAVLRARPLEPEAWRGAGRAAAAMGEHEVAARYLGAYLRAAPRHGPTNYHLALALFSLGRYEEAAQAFERAATLLPDNVPSQVGAGIALACVGRLDDADRHLARALALEDAGAELPFANRTQLALLRITRGDWARGWADHESRWSAPGALAEAPAWRRRHVPWDGAPSDRTLYLHADGGNGDVFLFARWFPQVASRVGRLVIVAPRATWRTVLAVPGASGATDTPDLDEDALHASMWALPHLFAATPDTLPARTPYLAAPDDGPRLPPAAGALRVGVVWAGDANATLDVDRSCPSPAVLAPLFAVPGVELVSLQVGPRAGEADGLPMRPCPPVRDFADTAFVIAQLDAVVSVDTAVANLALALGTPTWVLVPMVPEFRWPRQSPRSPWYPAAHVVRRTHVTAWRESAERVAADLGAWARA